jgi:hypothetical protein
VQFIFPSQSDWLKEILIGTRIELYLDGIGLKEGNARVNLLVKQKVFLNKNVMTLPNFGLNIKDFATHDLLVADQLCKTLQMISLSEITAADVSVEFGRNQKIILEKS